MAVASDSNRNFTRSLQLFKSPYLLFMQLYAQYIIFCTELQGQRKKKKESKEGTSPVFLTATGPLPPQDEMVFMKPQKSVSFPFSEFNGQTAAFHPKIIRKLLPGERNIKFVRSELLRFGRKIGHEFFRVVRCPICMNFSLKRRFFPASSPSRLQIIRLWYAQADGHMPSRHWVFRNTATTGGSTTTLTFNTEPGA